MSSLIAAMLYRDNGLLPALLVAIMLLGVVGAVVAQSDRAGTACVKPAAGEIVKSKLTGERLMVLRSTCNLTTVRRADLTHWYLSPQEVYW